MLYGLEMRIYDWSSKGNASHATELAGDRTDLLLCYESQEHTSHSHEAQMSLSHLLQESRRYQIIQSVDAGEVHIITTPDLHQTRSARTSRALMMTSTCHGV